jgi:hypothetical protein
MDSTRTTKRLVKKHSVNVYPWKFGRDFYYLDKIKNKVYCYKTEELIGEYIIDSRHEIDYIKFY